MIRSASAPCAAVSAVIDVRAALDRPRSCRALACVAAAALAAAGTALADGRIVLAHDEWTLSNAGFAAPSQPGVFAANVLAWFNDGQQANVLVSSSNFGLTQSQLLAAIQDAGHTVTVSAAPLTAEIAAGYDAIFLCAQQAPAAVLVDFVMAGGSVYVCGGTGGFSEAGAYNEFLEHFGLAYETGLNGFGAQHRPIAASHPIFAGVGALYEWNGTSVVDLDPGDPRNAVLVSHSGEGLYAVYDPEATCVGDVNGDGVVDGADLGSMLAAWGSEDLDLNGDGINDGADLGIVLASWGACEG